MAGGGDGPIEGINVTPLVDVMLVLLVTFLVTAQLLEAEAVPLDLPRASQAETVQVVLAVTLPAQGPTLLDGRPLEREDQLRAAAARALASAPELRAVVNADGAVPHRRVLEVLDQLRAAGVSRVAFGAWRAEPPPP